MRFGHVAPAAGPNGEGGIPGSAAQHVDDSVGGDCTGSRVFDVTAEGSSELDAYDIYAAAGASAGRSDFQAPRSGRYSPWASVARLTTTMASSAAAKPGMIS